MKRLSKLICVLMVALMLAMPFTVSAKTTKKTTTTTTTTTTAPTTFAVSEDEKAINIYVFYSSTCPHCAELHTYLAELKKDDKVKDKFNVVDYEVSNSVNNELMVEVGEYFGVNVTGVPFYVIGDNYYEGFGDSSKSTLVSAIENAYKSSSYKDVVAGIISGEIEDESNDIVGMVILGICVVIIIALIVCSSKNKYYEEDEEEEEEEEKVPEKKEVDKTPAKKSSSTKSTKSTSKNTKAKSNNTKSKKK